jgi:acetyltransferase-like isoleucine patch superfamily enzyme
VRPWHEALSLSQKRRIRALLYAPRMLRDMLFCRWHGLAWDSGWRLYGLPLVQRKPGSRLVVGRRFTAGSDPRQNAIGINQRVTLKTVARGAVLTIGDDVGCSGCTVSAALAVTIGDRVLLGSGCLITDSDAHPLRSEERADPSKTKTAAVVVEDDAFIGARAIVLKGVRIGRGSVIGAGAVVTRDVPPRAVAAGNPARVIRRLD